VHHPEDDVLSLEVAIRPLSDAYLGIRKVLPNALPPLVHQELFVDYNECRNLKLGHKGAREYRFPKTRNRTDNPTQTARAQHGNDVYATTSLFFA
jgi:hypothetical protein